ncbi:hypothetical protein NDU88_004763 [Pleurodeles waltl]|uniref:Uncharacterized protein n=1 Tax=Pleurodeles waltl TaxID=8319 RepID=A0AAV7VH55_PLEWA|nr:hypothetical protein NDU88_004763 [Pleurodeles waltl]
MAGGSPRAGAGDSGSSEAGARDEALGERRPSPASVPPGRKGQPAGGPKDAEKCLSTKAVRLREQARRWGPGRRSILGPRTQGSLTFSKPSKPRPGWKGPGRSSVGGGAPEGKRRSGFTLKSDPVHRELLEVRPSRQPSWS